MELRHGDRLLLLSEANDGMFYEYDVVQCCGQPGDLWGPTGVRSAEAKPDGQVVRVGGEAELQDGQAAGGTPPPVYIID